VAQGSSAGGPAGRDFHDLRHVFASLLIASGLNIRIVQARMGHQHASMTLDIYSHLMPGDDDAGRGAVGAAFAENLHASSARGHG